MACFFTRTACVPGRPWASSLRGALPVYAAIPTVPALLRALPYLADHTGSVRRRWAQGPGAPEHQLPATAVRESHADFAAENHDAGRRLSSKAGNAWASR